MTYEQASKEITNTDKFAVLRKERGQGTTIHICWFEGQLARCTNDWPNGNISLSEEDAASDKWTVENEIGWN